MTRRWLLFVVIGLLFAVGLPRSSGARVVRFVVEQRRSFAGGTSFGHVGPYERLDGTAYMEVDPSDPLNAVVVNLDKAPRNAQGMVEFSAPFFILKPVDMARGNHKIFYGVNNRGNKQTLGYWNFVPSGPGINDPITAADAGDGFLMRLGYTVVDAGWQGDVAPGGSRLFPNFPVAVQSNGSPIVAAVRIEYTDRTIPQAGTFTQTLEGSPNFRSYETADTNTANSTLTIRDTVSGPKVAIPSSRWAFGTCPTGAGSLVPNTTNICLFDGFRADKLYELIYPAKNPTVMGLGHAVTRDIGSFLRYQTRDDAGNANPLALSPAQVGIRRAYSFGSSSTGMYQREFLYLGFNADESHRKVFDGLWIHKAGTHRLFANVEFADPNTYSRQDDRHDFLSTSVAPFTHAVTTDPISGIHDGLVKRPATDPLVFQSDTGNELWEMKGSLNAADGLGRPVRLPGNARLYFLSSFQHGGNNPPAAFPGAAGMCQNPTNPNYHGPTVRALLMALDAWADQGIEPPKSNYPSVENKTLVSLAEAREAFPAIPGVNFPTVVNELELLNYGPEFDSEGGRLTLLPPALGPSYRILVAKPDEDGLDIAGIRQMEIRVPLGTNAPWNVRAAGFRAPSLCGLSGSYIPFATTKAVRLAAGDPRKSLEERYKDHDGYVKAVEKGAKELMHEGFLLQEDADRFISAAEASNVAAQFYEQHNLVSDGAVPAPLVDPNMVNAWGLVSSPTSPWWISDNGTGKATLYRVNTGAISLVVTVPGAMGRQGTPTGLVFNGGTGFVVNNGAGTSPARFIFASEDGTISGFRGVPVAIAVDNSASGAVYKGLAIDSTTAGNFLYATNFHAGTVDVFDSSFHPVTMPPGAFSDPDLPAGYAPFGIQNLGGTIYVTYALQDAARHDDVPGEGHGFVNAFDTAGHLLRRVASRGKLNSPWGLALAPADFGHFSNGLLVGNFGNGRINAFDPERFEGNGELKHLGSLHAAEGRPIEIDGLWALAFGSGSPASGPTNTLFFTAGPADEQHGLFGTLVVAP